MADYNKIIFSDIPSILPVAAYQESYIFETELFESSEIASEIIFTADKLRLLNSAISEKLQIQATLYKQYEFSFINRENINIELLRAARKISIEGVNFNSCDCWLTDIKTSFIADTRFKKVTITLKKKENDSQSICNYLQSDILLNTFSASNLVKLELSNTNIQEAAFGTFYTAIAPIYNASEILESKSANTDIEIVDKSVVFDTAILHFYFNETDCNTFDKYLNVSWFISSGVPRGTKLTINGTSYYAIERATATREKLSAYGLYHRVMTVKLSKNTFYPFN